MDNGTMVEAFKYMNYCQLAKNSLVSKRFWNLIRNNRRRLALLYVHSFKMYSTAGAPAAIKIFDKELSSEAYDEWVIRNSYSKEVPLEDQVASTESSQIISNVYRLYVSAYYKNPSCRKWDDKICVFSARVKVNHVNWPVFQHFVRLLTDPFIYVDHMELSHQNNVLNLLGEAINSEHDYLQCKELDFHLESNTQTPIIWAKSHLRCKKFYIYGDDDLNQDEAFLDFFVTGARCTPSIVVRDCDLSKAVVDFVQKFMDLKKSDENQMVESIRGVISYGNVEGVTCDYATFIIKEERNEDDEKTVQVFEFVNADIAKKLQLTVEICGYIWSHFSVKIDDL